MWWQAGASIAAIITAVMGAGVGLAGYIRSAASSAAATGLEYMERALQAQQDQIMRQQGEIGELRGQLQDCRAEREVLSQQIAALQERMP
jgi:hypothetical protein